MEPPNHWITREFPLILSLLYFPASNSKNSFKNKQFKEKKSTQFCSTSCKYQRVFVRRVDSWMNIVIYPHFFKTLSQCYFIYLKCFMYIKLYLPQTDSWQFLTHEVHKHSVDQECKGDAASAVSGPVQGQRGPAVCIRPTRRHRASEDLSHRPVSQCKLQIPFGFYTNVSAWIWCACLQHSCVFFHVFL